MARRRGLDPSEVLAFGDGNNDVSLLRWASGGGAIPHGRPAALDAK